MAKIYGLVYLFGCFPLILGESVNRLYISGFDSTYLPKDTPTPPKPLMWIAQLKTDRAVNAGFEHLIFDYKNYFELYLGCSGAYLETFGVKSDQMFAVSSYVLARVYIVKRKGAALFFLYSPAGPSMLSKSTFSTTGWSNHFVFQNQFGIGVSHNRFPGVEFFIKQYHYSNGGIFPINGGADIRLSVGMSVKI